jgi:serine/threonine protein kinase
MHHNMQHIGPYTLHKTLATGTFGTIFLAQHERSPEHVVLKTLKMSSNVRLGRDLFPLGDRLRELSHPALLPTLASDFTHEPPYVVTAHAPGGTLEQRIAQASHGGLPLDDAMTIIHAIASALTYLHQQQIIHRGVQPSCILFDQQGQVSLAGMDLAVSTKSPFLSRVRTACYSAPEQEEGEASEPSDQYSLGVIAYELVLGTPPDQQSPAHLMRALERKEISSAVGRALLRATAEAPEQRWPSVAELVSRLRDHK